MSEAPAASSPAVPFAPAYPAVPAATFVAADRRVSLTAPVTEHEIMTAVKDNLDNQHYLVSCIIDTGCPMIMFA